MPETGLNKTPRTKSVVTPGLNALTLPAHPVSEQIAIIRIGPVGVSTVRVENPGSVVGAWGAVLDVPGKIRVTSLDSKIQLIQLGNLCQVHPRPNGGIPPVGYWRKFVFNKRFGVKTQPISHSRNSECKVESRSAVSRVRSGFPGWESNYEKRCGRSTESDRRQKPP